jgi:hypothetical protein
MTDYPDPLQNAIIYHVRLAPYTYEKITKERGPKQPKLKNVTPQKKKLSLSFKEVSNGS